MDKVASRFDIWIDKIRILKAFAAKIKMPKNFWLSRVIEAYYIDVYILPKARFALDGESAAFQPR